MSESSFNSLEPQEVSSGPSRPTLVEFLAKRIQTSCAMAVKGMYPGGIIGAILGAIFAIVAAILRGSFTNALVVALYGLVVFAFGGMFIGAAIGMFIGAVIGVSKGRN